MGDRRTGYLGLRVGGEGGAGVLERDGLYWGGGELLSQSGMRVQGWNWQLLFLDPNLQLLYLQMTTRNVPQTPVKMEGLA